MRALVLILIAALIIQTAITTTNAQDSSGSDVNIEIVFDVSGSMGAATDTGEMRMTAAQRVMTEVISVLPDSERVNVGLRLYGHKGNNTEAGKAESCAASDLVVPINGVDKVALQTQVDALVPTGWTPTGSSIEKATADFQAIASPDSTNAIIVLTDGIETCGGDPAAAATAARNGTPSISTYVIGFALAPEDKESIAAIARAGGGEPFNASNAGQLISALLTVLDELNVVDTGGDGSTREEQLGLGKIGRVGDYDVNIISVQQDATQSIMEHNPSNEAPKPGFQFFVARVSVTYKGTTTGQPATELDFQAVGDLNKGYAWYTDTCGDYPEAGYMVTTDLFPDGSAEFNVCWQIDAEDSSSLVMYASDFLDFDGEPVWFNLGNPMPVRESDDTPEEATPAAASDESSDSGFKNGQARTEEAEAPGGTGDGSAREQPIAIGQTAAVGDYEIMVLSFNPDATDDIMAFNQFNEPPSAGNQFAMVRVSVTYTGDTSGQPAFDLDFQSVGNENRGYAWYTDTCGVIPDEAFTVATDLFPGGAVEFNVCWQIRSEDAGSLTMYVSDFLDFDGEPVWLQLQ